MKKPKHPHESSLDEKLENWSARMFPPIAPLIGRYCRLERMDAAHHAKNLYTVLIETMDGRNPFGDFADFELYVKKQARMKDPLHHVISDAKVGTVMGTVALMRIDIQNGVAEIGHVNYGPRLQRSRAGTEAIYLLMRRLFDDLGYRRCEWRCDSLDETLRQAAVRYGFAQEGISRQAGVYKGRNRDTVLFSMIDSEWSHAKAAFELWLRPDNFDEDGKQRKRLSEIRTELARRTVT